MHVKQKKKRKKTKEKIGLLRCFFLSHFLSYLITTITSTRYRYENFASDSSLGKSFSLLHSRAPVLRLFSGWNWFINRYTYATTVEVVEGAFTRTPYIITLIVDSILF